jgi:hypothetical protein
MELNSSALLAAAALYATIMPNLGDVRRSARGTEMAADVRNGLIVGSALLVGIGVLLSADAKSPKPLYMLGGVAVLTAGAFELTLRQGGARTVTAEPGQHSRSLGRYGV